MTNKHALVLKKLVSALRSLPHIEAILTYGSTSSQTWKPGSDIDLIVITSERPPVESIHMFHDGIPVDLSIRNRLEWENGDTKWIPPDGLVALWDPENLGQFAQSRTNHPDNARHFRYAHRHLLLKLERWQSDDPITAEMLAANAVHWVIVSYFHARGMRFPGIDKAVPYFRTNEPEILECLLAAVRSSHERLANLRRACEIALAPVGGLWRDDEVFYLGWSGNPNKDEALQAKEMFKPVIEPGSP